MYIKKSVRRYEGQLILMAEPIPLPKRPPRTPSRHSSFFLLRTDGQRPIVNTERPARTPLRTILHAVCGEAGAVCRGPRPTSSFGPSVNYHRLGW